MSIRLRNRIISISLSTLAVLLLASGTIFALRGPTEGATDARQVVLIAEGMTFMGGNPVVQVAPGETIEFVLVNRDPGMRHDLAIPSLGATTQAIGAGEETTLRVTIPQVRAPTTYQYLCTMHPVTMTGVIEVVLP